MTDLRERSRRRGGESDPSVVEQSLVLVHCHPFEESAVEDDILGQCDIGPGLCIPESAHQFVDSHAREQFLPEFASESGSRRFAAFEAATR